MIPSNLHATYDTSKCQAELAADVERALKPAQGALSGLEEAAPAQTARVIDAVTRSMVENLIEIPEIVVIPSREVNFWFSDFDLEGLAAIRFQPLSDRILIRNLRDDLQRELNGAPGGAKESRIENYVVTERRFAFLMKRQFERTVLCWIKPGPGQFGI